jgi:hypothetical protein
MDAEADAMSDDDSGSAALEGGVMNKTTTLNEVARALSELHFERQSYGAFVVTPEEELKVLKELFRQCAVSIGEHVNDGLCNLVAVLILEAMIAQQDCETTAR